MAGAVTKAVVLAAGEGTRLEPLTAARPKPMLPVANRPLLEHVLESVAAAGITEVVLVVGYKRERIQDHFGDGDDWGLDLRYVAQETQLGTGHAILQAESVIGEEFIALNGDRVIDPELIEAVAETRHATGDPVIAVTRVAEPSRYGVVEVEGELVRRIREKPPANDATSELINAGVYGFGPEVFAALRRTDVRGELAITRTLANLLETRQIRAVPYRGRWLDVSRPWDLLSVNAEVLSRERAGGGRRMADTADLDDAAFVAETAAIGQDVSIQPGAVVHHGCAFGDNVHVGPNAVISNSVLMSDVTVGPGTVLTDCVIGANTRVGPNVTAEGGRADVILGDSVYRDVKLGGVVGDNARLGGNVTVAPGTVLGNATAVEGGVTVSGRIASEATVRSA